MFTFSACIFVCYFLSCGNGPTKSHVEYLQTVKVKNATMSYVDTGGDSKNTVVFLHGNPTSSYLWRNVYPKISSLARCFAPDLIGMGRSDKLENSMYRFVDHYEYLSAWFDEVVTGEKITLVIHDWGSALGFHWANMNRDRVEAIVHMESVVDAMEGWNFTGDAEGEEFFHVLRSPAGDDLILQKNMFIEILFPTGIVRNLTDEEMSEYRRPFLNPGEDRRPMLTFVRQLPVKGSGPPDVIAFADAYNEWLSTTNDMPKLMIKANPGFLTPWMVKATKNWPNHTKVTIRGHHFIQEDAYEELSDVIYCFLSTKVFKGRKG